MPYVACANAGDHALVHRLLLAVQQNPPWERFSAWLEDPYYDPSDRILLRRGNQIIGHVHITHRTVHWGGERLPSAGLHDLVALPEYDEPAGTGELLTAAEDRLRDEGVVLAMMRTPHPERYQRLGWVLLPKEGFSRAGAHDILAHVTAHPQADKRERKYRVRTWRHVEIDKMVSLYAKAASDQFGSIWRNDRYWHWLIGRKDHDHILLAETGRSKSDAFGRDRRCVAYAVIRQDRIIELIVLPGHEAAAVSLLARACREITESGFHTLTLFLPVEHPLHEMLLTAGGEWCAVDGKPPGRPVCKIFQFDRYIERMYAVLHRRARDADQKLPCRIAFDIDGRSFVFVLTRRSVRLERDAPAPPDAGRISCSMDTFQRLLIGQVDPQTEGRSGGLRVSGPAVREIAATLFSPVHAWQSLWDSPSW